MADPLATQDTEEIIRTVQLIAPVFGGINLEDIAAPRVLRDRAAAARSVRHPVFRDDQHGATKPRGLRGALGSALERADVFISVSVPPWPTSSAPTR